MRGSPARHRLRRRLAVAVMVTAAVAAAADTTVAHAACPDPSPGRPARPRPPANGKPLVFYGHGNGHGMGMSQYGARGAARLGCSTARILSTYYRGTHLRRVNTNARFDVLMLDGGGNRATVTVEPQRSPATVSWRHRGRRVAVQREGTTWTVRAEGSRTRLIDGSGRIRFDALASATAPLRGRHTNHVVRMRTYRAGHLVTSRRLKYDAGQFFVASSGLDVRQNFFTNPAGNSMDKYLFGLAEVPTSWPGAAQRAQAIAARTYAVRQARPLRPTPADQFYGGYDRLRDSPTSPWRRAVEATSDTVIVDGGERVINALYSASMGGFTEDPRYVWDVPAVPYLRAVDDSNWDRAAEDPYLAWTATFRYSRIADVFGFDRVTAMSVAPRGTTARHAGVRISGRINGSSTTRFVPGWDVREGLGLRSPGFVIVTR